MDQASPSGLLFLAAPVGRPAAPPRKPFAVIVIVIIAVVIVSTPGFPARVLFLSAPARLQRPGDGTEGSRGEGGDAQG